MPTDRPRYPDGSVVMDEHVTAEYVAELSARIAELEAEVERRRSAIVELSHAAADVIAWFDLIRPDLSGPRIHRLRTANAALAAPDTGGAADFICIFGPDGADGH